MHTPDGNEDAFGFGAIRPSAKDRIRSIKPAAPPEPPSDLTRLDAAADNVGFVSREVPTALAEDVYSRRGRPRGPEAFQALNMRAPASLATAFRRWCEENRYSYPAGLAEIMRRAGIPTK
jgi:hypothetical protein